MKIYSDIPKVTESDLQRLIDNKVTESATLDYKRELWGNNDAGRKDFLIDISAMANSEGGTIIVGIAEDKSGLPTNLEPIIDLKWDQTLAALDARIRDGIDPRIPIVKFHEVKSEKQDGSYLLIEVVKSWNAPHRVSYNGTNKFYGRAANSNYQFSVDQLRDIFNRQSGMMERLHSYRTLRIQKIKNGVTPVDLEETKGIFVAHLVPAQSLLSNTQIDLENAFQIARSIPISGGFSYPGINFEGLIHALGTTGGHYEYTQFNRNGIVEFVRPQILYNKFLQVQYFGSDVHNLTREYLQFLERLDIAPPIFLLMSFLSIKGSTIPPKDSYSPLEPNKTIMKDDLLLPTVEIPQYAEHSAILRQTRFAFDALWNSVGVMRSPMFDSNGDWVFQPS